MIDINNIIEQMKKTIDKHNLGRTGEYSRWLWQDNSNCRDLGINEYGCADAANILYTIGYFPSDSTEREKWIESLQNLQHKDSGLFKEVTHHPIHTTAHCIAALELFDAKPLYELSGFNEYKSIEGLKGLLESLDWYVYPWPQSHKGAGIYASLSLTGEVSREWKEYYFEWFWNEADPVTGLWRKDCIFEEYNGEKVNLFYHLASSFHYLFNHEYAKMPLRYPEKIIDSCLKIYNENIWEHLGKEISFPEIDWIYCLTRSMRQSKHRFEESKIALKEFAINYIDYLNSLDYETHEGFNDLHMLFGAICAIAELQQALPGFIKTDIPLKLVLDRRPFI